MNINHQITEQDIELSRQVAQARTDRDQAIKLWRLAQKGRCAPGTVAKYQARAERFTQELVELQIAQSENLPALLQRQAG